MNKTRKNRSVYKKTDFDSNDGMLTSVWGPSMWHYLHTMSFNYPAHPNCDDKQHYREFVLNLRFTLPCGKCRTNLTNNFKRLPLKLEHMKNRETFSKYIFRLHELINKMLGKKSGLTYNEVRERYEHFRARCSKSYKDLRKDLRKTAKKQTKEKGCTEPLYGEKSKCVLRIVPFSKKIDTLEIDNKCIKRGL
uniref:thiol oxidase n=1 Tax=viral metagenome TaxID=1070528 RepID=A0A6C0B673_9ZZZZ